MTHHMTLAATAIALGLTGCSLLRPFDSHCSGQECKVAVTVGPNCAITADPDELEVRLGTGPVNIRWKLDPGSGFVFDDQKGITFKQNPNEFDEKRPEDQGKQFHWRDKNTQQGRFAYGITLRDKNDPSRICRVDPLIYNH